MNKQQLNEELKAWKERLDRGEITEAAILQALNIPVVESAQKAVSVFTEDDLAPEQVIGAGDHQFKLVERLDKKDKGAMGQVWKAVDLNCKGHWPNRDCYRALKFPPTVWMSDETAKKNLKREADAAKLLDCPHTVKVYGWHEQQRGNNLPSQVFIEMEYLEGKSFAQHLKDDWKGGLPFERVMELIEPVAQSLDCAHQKHQFIHRDIKPANLFLTEAGEVMVLDFGIADEYRKTDASLGTKLKEQMYRSSGTPGYMAPEVSTRKPEPRQDVHALACVIYELLTGKPAFKITQDTPRYPHTYRSPPETLTQAAWEVLKKGFAFEAEQRPASAGKLISRLKQAHSQNSPPIMDRGNNKLVDASRNDRKALNWYHRAVEWYRKAVGLGDASAMSELGWRYENGKGVPQDDKKAVEWYQKAARLGDASAMRRLGDMYEEGRGVSNSDKKAVKWYRKAAGLGDASAMSELGWRYENGKGVPQDDKMALEWYRKAVALGNSRAMGRLGFMYSNARGVPLNDIKAVEWYRKAVELGDASAMRLLGWMYEEGRGVSQDIQQALEWYRKAAGLGDATAMAWLGWMYNNGRGVSQSTRQALEWYRKAAGLGNILAMRELGAVHGEGPLKSKYTSFDDAMKWWGMAARLGDTWAMRKIGDIYCDHQSLCYFLSGRRKDYRKAEQWYRKAAELGDISAMRRLGYMYEKGLGVSKSSWKANKWYRKADKLERC